jgi:hypothetical protein
LSEKPAEKSEQWVELPNCKGQAGEIKLNDDLTNATVATCKPGPKSLSEKPAEKSEQWVELPNCKGQTGEIRLNDDLTNATVATCKPGPKSF